MVAILRQYEEWGIKLEKKIKNKLSFKIFLGITTALIVTFSLCLLAIQIAFPRLYEREFLRRTSHVIEEIFPQIEEMSLNEISELVIAFCFENHANMTISKQSYDQRNTDDYELIYSFNFNTWEEETEVSQLDISLNDRNFGPTYNFKIEMSRKSIHMVSEIIDSIVPYLYGLIIMVSVGVAFIYSRYLARPIVSISQISEKMRQLDWSERCQIDRTDEIGDLAHNLNEMAGKLEKALSNLQDEMQQRNHLFTAVSHELKTPITILKGELLGMIDKIGDYKNRDTYLQHAYETTESMEQLVHEILTVSRLELKGVQLDYRRVNISQLVNKICQSHEELANNRTVALICYCEDNLVGLADTMQLRKAISNMINNAIFHSPAGEIVTIQLVKDDEVGILTVENSGGYIPVADQEHIFQPFYRTDRSRNRHSGGSGLGLYIVKTILDLHCFHYELVNSEEGVIFKMTFPLS